MDALEAIRKRCSVRWFTDRPVSAMTSTRSSACPPRADGRDDPGVDPGGARAREAGALADVIRGGPVLRHRPPPGGGRHPEEHAEWAAVRGRGARDLSEGAGVDRGAARARNAYPLDPGDDWERDADMVSVGFMFENLMVAARAKGLGTVPTVFQWFVEDEFRALLDLPPEVEVPWSRRSAHPRSSRSRLRRRWRGSAAPGGPWSTIERWGEPPGRRPSGRGGRPAGR